MHEYIYLIIVFIFVLLFAYIKLRYPFWNVQPAFHVYDFWRFWTRTPFYIQNGVLIKTKFYDGKSVETIPYIETTDYQRAIVVDLLQCHYIDSDRVINSIDASGLHAIMTGHSNSSYISFYNDTTYDIFSGLDQSGNGGIKPVKFLIGCMLTRPAKFFIWDSFSKMHEFNVYHWDYICTHRDHKQISRKLIQTSEYNCRIKTPDILASVFKKEESLCEGIVPFVQFKTFTFYLRNVKIPRLPPNFTLVRIYKENMGILSDFMYGLTHPKSAIELSNEARMESLFKAFFMPEIGAITGMLLLNHWYAFALINGNQVYGIYFFRNAHVIYEDIQDGNLLECIAAVSNTKADGLFFSGFLSSLRNILDLTSNKYKMMTINDLGHNKRILEKWRWKYTPVFENPAAYYVYNMVCPGMPLNPGDCFFM